MYLIEGPFLYLKAGPFLYLITASVIANQGIYLTASLRFARLCENLAISILAISLQKLYYIFIIYYYYIIIIIYYILYIIYLLFY